MDTKEFIRVNIIKTSLRPVRHRLYNHLNNVITTLCREITATWEGMILSRLKEMGYDIIDKEAIAKRCELRIIEGDEVREIWIDTNTPDQALVCCYTETEVIIDQKDPFKITTEFKFCPMPEDS